MKTRHVLLLTTIAAITGGAFATIEPSQSNTIRSIQDDNGRVVGLEHTDNYGSVLNTTHITDVPPLPPTTGELTALDAGTIGMRADRTGVVCPDSSTSITDDMQRVRLEREQAEETQRRIDRAIQLERERFEYEIERQRLEFQNELNN